MGPHTAPIGEALVEPPSGLEPFSGDLHSFYQSQPSLHSPHGNLEDPLGTRAGPGGIRGHPGTPEAPGDEPGGFR